MVGGGSVAERKVVGLLKAGGRVTVISPMLTGALEAQANSGYIHHIKRRYRAGDTEGAAIVIAATSDGEVNARVASDASNALLNVVDDPSKCSFIVPSVIRRGGFTVAISTGGESPSSAKAMRIKIEEALGADAGLMPRPPHKKTPRPAPATRNPFRTPPRNPDEASNPDKK